MSYFYNSWPTVLKPQYNSEAVSALHRINYKPAALLLLEKKKNNRTSAFPAADASSSAPAPR